MTDDIGFVVDDESNKYINFSIRVEEFDDTKKNKSNMDEV